MLLVLVWMHGSYQTARLEFESAIWENPIPKHLGRARRLPEPHMSPRRVQRSFDWARACWAEGTNAALTDPLVCRAAAAVSASRSPDNSNSARQTCTCIACYRPNAQLPPAAQSVGWPTPSGGRTMASFHGALDSGRSRRGGRERASDAIETIKLWWPYSTCAWRARADRERYPGLGRQIRGLDYWPAKPACSHVRKSGVGAARKHNAVVRWVVGGWGAVKGDLAVGSSVCEGLRRRASNGWLRVVWSTRSQGKKRGDMGMGREGSWVFFGAVWVELGFGVWESSSWLCIVEG